MTALELLKKIEWAATEQAGEGHDSFPGFACPSCRALKVNDAGEVDKHAPTCELDRMIKLIQTEWSDKPDQWTKEIEAVHPARSSDPKLHASYAVAMQMIGNRQSKYALVDLVHWLLTKVNGLKAELLQSSREAKAAKAYAESLDNVREALGLESTHYLVIADDVADVVKERDALRLEVAELRKGRQEAAGPSHTERINDTIRTALGDGDREAGDTMVAVFGHDDEDPGNEPT